MIIDRPEYMDRLISKIGNGMIKVITGVRRCGKSYLLFNLFSDGSKSADPFKLTLVEINI